MPKLAIRPKETMEGLLQYRPLEGESIGRTIVLVCKDQTNRIGEIRTLAEFLRKYPPPGL